MTCLSSGSFFLQFLLMKHWRESEFCKPELHEAGNLICESLGLVDNPIKGLKYKMHYGRFVLWEK